MTFVVVAWGPRYLRMAGKLEQSIRIAMPRARVILYKPPEIPEHRPGYSNQTGMDFIRANTIKLDAWAKILRALDGNVVLLDADTIVLRDLSDVFDLDFDAAYTVRPKFASLPFNSGVVFVRTTSEGRGIIERWAAVNARIAQHGAAACGRYVGPNQAAWAEVLEDNARHRVRGKIIRVPCAVYNSVQETWREWTKDTAIVHLKCQLRDVLLRECNPSDAQKREYGDIVAACVRAGYEEVW